MNEFDKVLNHYGLFMDADVYKVVCPFHGDLNPSLQINREKQYYYCYGCGAHGGALEMVKGFNPKLDPLKATMELKKLARGRQTGIQNTPQVVQISNKKRLSQAEAVKQARQFYSTLPDPNWYKPGSNEAIYEETLEAKRYMTKRGFTPTILTKMGAKPSLNTSYPIVFPILENEKFKGYVMRTFDPEVEAKRKYLYNDGFRRQLTLPGIYTKGQPLMVVEGYLDCLKAIQLGIPNVVALLGWKASRKQLNKIARNHIPYIICALDRDEAGDKGYRYLKEAAKQYNIPIKRLHYPKTVKDFGDVQKGSKELKQIKQFIKSLERRYKNG